MLSSLHATRALTPFATLFRYTMRVPPTRAPASGRMPVSRGVAVGGRGRRVVRVGRGAGRAAGGGGGAVARIGGRVCACVCGRLLRESPPPLCERKGSGGHAVSATEGSCDNTTGRPHLHSRSLVSIRELLLRASDGRLAPRPSACAHPTCSTHVTATAPPRPCVHMTAVLRIADAHWLASLVEAVRAPTKGQV